jgi:hypothetical protein
LLIRPLTSTMSTRSLRTKHGVHQQDGISKVEAFNRALYSSGPLGRSLLYVLVVSLGLTMFAYALDQSMHHIPIQRHRCLSLQPPRRALLSTLPAQSSVPSPNPSSESSLTLHHVQPPTWWFWSCTLWHSLSPPRRKHWPPTLWEPPSLLLESLD